MPRIMQVTVYKFDELSPKAQKRALEKEVDFLRQDFDSEYLNDYFKEQLDAVGLPSKDIQWSLGYSQGDGVAFYGRFNLSNYLKLNKLTKKYAIIKKIIDGGAIDMNIEGSRSRYHHWNSMSLEANVSEDLTPPQQKALDELTEEISEQLKELSHKFEKDGYAEIEYQSSEEMAKEVFEANDAEFDEHGKRIYGKR